MSEEVDIQWGPVKNFSKAKIFYSSFISEGVEYKLFDNVEVHNGNDDNDDHSDPYIGKIVRLWEEKESRTRKVLIRWFFKLKDLGQEMEGDPRELYLAFGTGKGVVNENDLEVICGKCKVLCTSEDARNRQPSARDLKNADFFFSKIYNVDLQHLSPVQRVVDKLGCEVVYNKPEWVTEIPKNKEKAVEQLNSVQDCKRDSTLKRKAQCMGDSPSDLKDRQRDTDVIIGTQQKAGQESDLKRQQTSSMTEVSQNKKLKTAATTSPRPPTNVATANKIQKSENISSLGEVVASKIPTFGELVPSKVQQEELRKTTLPACVPSQTNLNTSNLERSSPQQTSTMNEVSQNKKLKTSATTSPRPRTNVATTNKIQKPENISSSGEVVASKIPTFGEFVGPSSKVQQELRKPDLPACAPSQTNLNISNLERSSSFTKTSVSETASLKVDDALGQQAARQLDEKGRADHNAVKEVCIDAQKIKEEIIEGHTNSLTRAKSASGLLEEKEEKSSLEMNSSASNSGVKGKSEGAVQADHKIGISLERKGYQAKGDSSSLPEPGNCFKESVVKEVRSDVAKKPILSTGSDSEKKLLSTTEPVRVVENWKIFKVLPWEQNLQQGILSERVLILQNLDPCLTSADVRDMLKNILQGVSDVRIIPQETICPYAQALAIFDSKSLAESALQEMDRKCLVVANNKRPLIASKFKEITNFSRFPGHLALEKLKMSSRNLGSDEYKKAVSTSHCSQPNTIEYEMAMEWRRVQEIIQTCRAELFEKQRKEMEEIRKGCGSEGR